jgi:hypothetical protein
VYDGPPGKDGTCIDVDYKENHSTLNAHWKGFHDPHSTMVEYFVNIGSCKDCEDVLVKQSVGIKTGKELVCLYQNCLNCIKKRIAFDHEYYCEEKSIAV